MNRKNLNYRLQHIECCYNCKHSRQSEDDNYMECSLMSEERLKAVDCLGICDSFKKLY